LIDFCREEKIYQIAVTIREKNFCLIQGGSQNFSHYVHATKYNLVGGVLANKIIHCFINKQLDDIVKVNAINKNYFIICSMNI